MVNKCIDDEEINFKPLKSLGFFFLLLIGFVLLNKYFINFFRPMTNKTRINFCFKIGVLVENMLLIKILSDCLL